MATKTMKIGLSNADKTNMANQITAETLNKLIPAFSTSVAYTKGQYTMYSNALYRFTADKSAGAWDSTKVESATLDDLIDDVNDAVDSVANKANVDGYYASMSVGLSDNFNTNMTIEDKSPYNFRTSGGSLEIANQCKEKAIVGGSVVFNQLCNYATSDLSENDNGIDFVYSATTKKLHIYGTATADISTKNIIRYFNVTRPSLTLNRKYLISGIDSIKNTGATIGGYNLGYSTSGNYIGTCQSDGQELGLYISIPNGTTIDIYIEPQVFDLTQMWQPTIANYIATLETGQAGAGVAWFRKYFNKPYYAYNAGSFLNVKTSGKKITHFNQWDEQWELGGINSTTGETYNDNTMIRSKNFIKVLPKTTYYFNKGGIAYYYDSDYNYISYLSTAGTYLFTTPSNCHYIKFRMGSNYGTTYNHDICINLHWDGERDGEYEAYSSTTYPIEDVELRGIPKLDSNNELYFDGDVYHSNGDINKNYVVVDLSTLTWTYISTTTPKRYQATLSTIKQIASNSTIPNLISDKYKLVTWNNGAGNVDSEDKIICQLGGNYDIIAIIDSSLDENTTPTGYLLYEKATPTTSTATPFTELEAVDNWGTEEFIDTREIPMPVGHITEYLPDLKAKLETAPENPDTDGMYVLKRDNGENSYSLLSTYLSANGYVVPTSITGYDATKTQVLKNVNGTFTWVDEE